MLTFLNLYKIFSSAVILSYSFFFFHLKNFSHLTTALFPFSFFLFTFVSTVPAAVVLSTGSFSGSATLSAKFRNEHEWIHECLARRNHRIPWSGPKGDCEPKTLHITLHKLLHHEIVFNRIVFPRKGQSEII